MDHGQKQGNKLGGRKTGGDLDCSGGVSMVRHPARFADHWMWCARPGEESRE